MRYMIILKQQTFEEYQRTNCEKEICRIPAHQVTYIQAGQNRIFVRYKNYEGLHYLEFKRSEVYLVFRELCDEKPDFRLNSEGLEYQYRSAAQKLKSQQEYITQLENTLKERCGESWASPDLK